MNLIDRHILARFLMNFAILFALLFLFAIAIDLILALERFVDATGRVVGSDAGSIVRAMVLLRLAANFEAPRFFQFYAYLHGLVAIGAMAFTLAQMHRYRELVAVLAAGVSLHRTAMAFVVGIFVLSILQLLNQEFLLPRVAPLLLRDHGQIGQESVDEFAVGFVPDGRGTLFQSPAFDPRTNTLRHVTILERDDRGRTVRRITAERATWSPGRPEESATEGWGLQEGRSVRLDPRGGTGTIEEAVVFYGTDLTPRSLIVRRYSEYAGMLSLRQIGQMLGMPGIGEQERLVGVLVRYRWVRFASVLVNVLVMWMTLPTFLLRQPASLLVRSMACAGIAVPAMLGAAVFMMADLPGIAPQVSVFLPVAVFIPIAIAQWMYVKT